MSEKNKVVNKHASKKILVICQYYYPEPFRIKDICEEMVRRGHEVQVITGYPNYPEGLLYKGYGRGKRIDEVINGVKVHRCFTIPRKKGIVYRLMNYYSYAFSSVRFVLSNKCVASNKKPFDVVFCNQLSPVMMASAAIAYKKKYNVPIVMYCLDLWPTSLIAGGIKRNSVIYKYFYHVSKRIYCQMDRILITSRKFKKYMMTNFGVEKKTIKYLPQYAEDIFEALDPKRENDTYNLLFAGNIGTAQSIETILKAAKILKEEPVRFHIVGDGTDLVNLKKIVVDNKLNNVSFYGRRPLEEMPEFYRNADAMLVTLKADWMLGLTLPGKVQSYMAVGRPIIGAINGETAEVIEAAKCGFCGKAEDENALADNIRRFMKSGNKTVMGRNARNYYEEHFMKERFMDTFETELAVAKRVF